MSRRTQKTVDHLSELMGTPNPELEYEDAKSEWTSRGHAQALALRAALLPIMQEHDAPICLIALRPMLAAMMSTLPDAALDMYIEALCGAIVEARDRLDDV